MSLQSKVKLFIRVAVALGRFPLGSLLANSATAGLFLRLAALTHAHVHKSVEPTKVLTFNNVPNGLNTLIPRLEMNNAAQLDPPNQHPHLVLPGGGGSVSARASSHDSIITAYKDGISFIDQVGAMHGYMTIISVWCLILPVWGIISIPERFGIPWFMVITAVLCIFFLREDNVKHHYHPVLFDRANLKVHLFVDVKNPWWKLWQLVPKIRIETWDWAQARAEVVEFVVVTGAAAPRTEYALVCAITERAGSGSVIARFGVGLSTSYNAEPMVQRWEHIRRFMAEQGPHLAPGDSMFLDESIVKFWHAITWGQPLLGPGSMEYWTGKGFNGMWYFTIPYGLLLLVFLPFTMISGLLRILSHWIKRAPKWSKEVLASVGPELTLADLNQMQKR